MNGYSVFNVHVGMNPTLTYRTVLAKKRNTHFEKNKKIFSEEQKKPADRSQRASLHPNIHFSTLKKGKKNKRSTTMQSQTSIKHLWYAIGICTFPDPSMERK